MRSPRAAEREQASTGDGRAKGRDLPTPAPLRRVIGPSLILLAVAMGSGELILWPFVSSRAGLGLLWVAPVGLLTQYFVNMEIERYTLATGETVVTGISRMWRHWAWIFLLFTIFPWVWPAWAVGASTIAGFALGWDQGAVVIVTVLGLIAIGLSLSLSPVVYAMVERVQGVVMALVAAFLVAAVVMATDLGTWATIVTEASLQLHPDITPGMILGLLVFAGAGGTLNLALSNWVRDKGMGMGAFQGPIESPLTGHPSKTAPIGGQFVIDGANLRRWGDWWKTANREQLIFFVLLGFAMIAALSALSATTVFGRDLGGGFDFIRAQGDALGERLGGWFRLLFLAAGALVLFSTNLGILDHVGRLIADIVKANWMAGRDAWTESKLYLIVVWSMIGMGTVILLLGLNEPLTLMVASAALSGLVMLAYSALLIRLNRRALPEGIRLRGPRLWAMAWSVILFGSFSVYVLSTAVAPLLFRSGIGGG